MRLILVLLLALAIPLAAQSPRSSGSVTTQTCPGSGCVSLSVSALSAVGIQITGTWTGTITFEGTIDGATYTPLNMTPSDSGTAVTSTTANGVWLGSCGGLAIVRARMSAAPTGSAEVTIQGAPGPPVQ